MALESRIVFLTRVFPLYFDGETYLTFSSTAVWVTIIIKNIILFNISLLFLVDAAVCVSRDPAELSLINK